MGEAMALYNRALAIHREVGDREYEGIVLGSLGNLHQIQNRQEEALAHYTQALTIHRDVGDLRYEGRVMNHLGRLYMKQGQKDEALAHYTQALAIAEEGGYRRSECEVLGNLGLLLASQGELVSARQHLAKAVGLLRKVLDSFLLGFVLCARGQVDLLAEDLPAARAALAEAEAITETLALTSEAPLRREIEGLRAALSEPR